MPLQGAIVVCYAGGGEGDGQLWRSGRGAIVVCYGWGGWGSGRGAIAGCHCSMVGGKVTANFGGVDVVPLQGAVIVCYGWGGG